MRNKVKLVATAAVAAGVVSLGATSLAGHNYFDPPTGPGNPSVDELVSAWIESMSSDICPDGAASIRQWVPQVGEGPVENFLENCPPSEDLDAG